MANISNKYHYFYKITNNINGHFYYGIHNTNNLDDGYMGSGTRLHYAYKKYGVENFTKEILKFFDTSKEAFEYEAEVVNEDLIKDDNCYNIKQGGEGWLTIGLRAVKDKDGNCFDVQKDDPRYLSGEVVSNMKGLVAVKDKENNHFIIDKNDIKYLTGELTGINKNNVFVKDNNGKCYWVDKTNKDYLSGKLINFWTNKKHKESTKEKMSLTHKVNKHQQGEKNSQYGTCWIHNNIKNKKIKKEELDNYINNGWVKGRKMKF